MSKLSGRSFGIALVLGLSTLASAGTYNFYFNNTEQGDNAVANPSVSVSTPPEAKAKSNRTETSQTPDSTAAAISVPDPTPPRSD